MKRVAACLAVVFVLGASGYVGLRYYRLMFESLTPETLIRLDGSSAPSLAGIVDPAERARAERGKYIVGLSGCDGCHHTPGPNGPLFGMYMAGGAKFVGAEGAAVARNLTPDAATGLGNVSDEDVLRALRSGVARDGRIMFHRAMPWSVYANWTEEDLRAVLTYMRHLKPIPHRTPDLIRSERAGDEHVSEEYFGADYGASAMP
jgi:hypothetical protein